MTLVAVVKESQIVDLYAEISIQTMLVINKDIDGRHDDTGHPQPYGSLVLQVQVDYTRQGAQYLQPVVQQIVVHKVNQNRKVTLPMTVKPAMGI